MSGINFGRIEIPHIRFIVFLVLPYWVVLVLGRGGGSEQRKRGLRKWTKGVFLACTSTVTISLCPFATKK